MRVGQRTPPTRDVGRIGSYQPVKAFEEQPSTGDPIPGPQTRQANDLDNRLTRDLHRRTAKPSSSGRPTAATYSHLNVASAICPHNSSLVRPRFLETLPL